MENTKEYVLTRLESLLTSQSSRKTEPGSNPLDLAHEEGKAVGYGVIIEEYKVGLSKAKTLDEFIFASTGAIKTHEKQLIEERSKFPWSDETVMDIADTKKKGEIGGKILALVDVYTLCNEMSSSIAKEQESARQAAGQGK